MITSNGNIELNSAQQKDKFVIVGGKENLVVDSRGKVYPMGGIAPAVAPTTRVITGGGALTPNIGYSYAYTYLNSYQDSETEPSPASAYIGRNDVGVFKTVRFSDDGLTVYISGEDLEKDDGYYDNQTIAIKIVNDEYVNIYSQWQYRKIKSYSYDGINALGEFALNRPFFNVDPDEADQEYEVKIEDLDIEDGIVGGKAKGNDKLILDANASQTPSDYRFKTIHITAGKGKGQKRIIVDATQREDGLIEITVDSPWKQKPKFLDPDKKDLYVLREQAEGQKGTKRKKNFYKQYYSSEYVISDPLRYNGYVVDANVDSYDDKGRRVKLSGLGHSGDLLTGKVVSYTDAKAVERDSVTIILDGDNLASEDTTTYTNKRFRIYDGAGAGLDARIDKVVKATDNRITLKIDVYGKMKKKDVPNGSSKCVIYAGESLSAQMIVEKQNKKECIFPRVFNAVYNDAENTATLVCCGYGGLVDNSYLCATEAKNVETYNSGRCYVMFKVKDNKKNVFYISRPIIEATTQEITEKDLNENEDRTYQRISITVGNLPIVNNERVEIYFGKDDKDQTKKGEYPLIDLDNKYAYFVYSDNLQDGYYTGWIAAFYNTSDTFAKGKKKVKTSRVAGYLDATGELLLCNGVAGVGEGWQCVLYSEYTRQIGSRVKVYAEDSYNPSYTSQTNSRYFCLDYFASSADDYYKDWVFEFLYGTAKKVKGKTIYQQDKNKKTYSVYAYDGKTRRIDCAGDENYAKGVRMKPAPTGNEFVTVYDKSSYIFKLFSSNDENDEDNTQNEGNNASADGVKMEVNGIVKSYLQGFDKIRLYRASESTETYRLVATLENKTQSYIDNVQESELTTELDFAHSAPTPSKYVASRNARFALANCVVDDFTASVYPNAYIGTEAWGSKFAKRGLGYSSTDYQATVVKTAPLIGVRFNENAKLVTQLPSEEITESLDLHILIKTPTTNGVVCGVEKRVAQSTIDNKVYASALDTDPIGAEQIIAVNSFYLSESESSQSNAFDNNTLRIIETTEVNGVQTDSVRYLNFGTDIDYDGSSRKVTLKNGTISLRFKVADLGDEYTTEGNDVEVTKNRVWLYVPIYYSIFASAFQVYYQSSKFYIYDGGTSTEIETQDFADGNAKLLIAKLPSLTSNSLIKINFGGDNDFRKFGDTLDSVLYYFSIAKRGVEDAPLISYVTSDLTFKQKWDYKIKGEATTSESTTLFGTIATVETGGRQTTLYVKHDDNHEPLITADELRVVVPNYNLLLFDKKYHGSLASINFFAKDLPLEVQITTAGAGLREKVELADTYNFNDGFGTKIMGIVDCRIGFIVFKDRGVYVLDPDKRVFQVVSHEFGCIASGSIAEGRGGIFWLSNGGRVEYQDFDNGNAVRDIGKVLRPWFDGDQTIDGNAVDWARIEAETTACFDSDYGDYIIAVPCKKNNANTTVILSFNETFEQWYRIEDSQSHNSAKCAFQFEGRGAFAGAYGIYDMKPDKTVINPWRYESRWRDDGANDVEKLVRRVKFNNFVDTSRSDNPVGNVDFYKDQKTTAEPNFLNWASIGNNTSHAFYTNQSKAQVETGVRGYIWKFVMYGLSYIKMKSMDVVVRKKEDNAPFLENSPNDNNNS